MDFKKGDRVLINSDHIKREIEEYEKLMKRTFGKGYEMFLDGDLKPEILKRSLNKEVAIITWVENCSNENSIVNLIFNDEFECSVKKISITKIN